MKRVLALALALCCLTACASLLEREYTVSSPHQEDPPLRGDGAYRVETYPALRSALLSYVEEGMDTGLLHFPTTYAGNLTVDMEKARRQLMEEDPLGCYALDELTFRTSKIIAYYEVELSFTYKVDPKSLASLPRVSTQSQLTALLAEMIDRGETEAVVYLTGYPDSDPDYFQTALDQALSPDDPEEEKTPPVDEEPQTDEALRAPPELTVALYPETGGSRRVAVLTLAAPQTEADHG